MALSIEVKKAFPEFTVSVSLEIKEREFLCIAGPSGSGKTTLLNILSGIVPIDEGKIVLDGQQLHVLPPEKRKIGYVFQNKYLFPHMTVWENVAFGVKNYGLPLSLVDDALERVKLTHLAHRRVTTLSGGEMQRVAIARAIAYRPPLLLLDEPFKELDALIRTQIIMDVYALHKELGCITIYVTHDLEEAFALADRIAILRNGVVEQVGPPDEVCKTPLNDFVREFLSPYVLISVKGGEALVKKEAFRTKKR